MLPVPPSLGTEMQRVPLVLLPAAPRATGMEVLSPSPLGRQERGGFCRHRAGSTGLEMVLGFAAASASRDGNGRSHVAAATAAPAPGAPARLEWDVAPHGLRESKGRQECTARRRPVFTVDSARAGVPGRRTGRRRTGARAPPPPRGPVPVRGRHGHATTCALRLKSSHVDRKGGIH